MVFPVGHVLLAQVSGGPSPSSPREFGFLFVFSFATLISHRYSSKEVILRPSCLLIVRPFSPLPSRISLWALCAEHGKGGSSLSRLQASSLQPSQFPTLLSLTNTPNTLHRKLVVSNPITTPKYGGGGEEGELATETLSLLQASKYF